VLLWIKALHVIFVVCWFAGLFYLPRLFVNHAMATEESVRTQLAVMERRLYRFIAPFAWLTALFGGWLLLDGWEVYRRAAWMHLKLGLVLLLVAYHLLCGYFVRRFAEGRNTRSHLFFRWFNEFPLLILVGAVVLVIVRPF
jgi:putative membrane protein